MKEFTLTFQPVQNPFQSRSWSARSTGSGKSNSALMHLNLFASIATIFRDWSLNPEMWTAHDGSFRGNSGRIITGRLTGSPSCPLQGTANVHSARPTVLKTTSRRTSSGHSAQAIWLSAAGLLTGSSLWTLTIVKKRRAGSYSTRHCPKRGPAAVAQVACTSGSKSRERSVKHIFPGVVN
ncbi:MAG: hypothetical protein RJA81_937 [Planctomycetota bacterium]